MNSENIENAKKKKIIYIYDRVHDYIQKLNRRLKLLEISNEN